MNTLEIHSPSFLTNTRDDDLNFTYASASQTRNLLKDGQQYRRERIEAADMLTTDQAASEAGTTRVTINAWIKTGRCIGLTNLRRGYKLPRWQFEPTIWPVIQQLSLQLGTTDGWQILSFLESPAPALDGVTPRAALEQGISSEKVLALAMTEAH